MVLSQSRSLSSLHKIRQKILLNQNPTLAPADAYSRKLHDTIAEMKIRKARMQLIIEKAKGERKIKLEKQLQQLKTNLNECERTYMELFKS